MLFLLKRPIAHTPLFRYKELIQQIEPMEFEQIPKHVLKWRGLCVLVTLVSHVRGLNPSWTRVGIVLNRVQILPLGGEHLKGVRLSYMKTSQVGKNFLRECDSRPLWIWTLLDSVWGNLEVIPKSVPSRWPLMDLDLHLTYGSLAQTHHVAVV